MSPLKYVFWSVSGWSPRSMNPAMLQHLEQRVSRNFSPWHVQKKDGGAIAVSTPTHTPIPEKHAHVGLCFTTMVVCTMGCVLCFRCEVSQKSRQGRHQPTTARARRRSVLWPRTLPVPPLLLQSDRGHRPTHLARPRAPQGCEYVILQLSTTGS